MLFANVSYCVSCFFKAQNNTAAVSVSLIVMEITDLRAELKKAQKKASEAAEKQCDGLSIKLHCCVSTVIQHIVSYSGF